MINQIKTPKILLDSRQVFSWRRLSSLQRRRRPRCGRLSTHTPGTPPRSTLVWLCHAKAEATFVAQCHSTCSACRSRPCRSQQPGASGHACGQVGMAHSHARGTDDHCVAWPSRWPPAACGDGAPADACGEGAREAHTLRSCEVCERGSLCRDSGRRLHICVGRQHERRGAV